MNINQKLSFIAGTVAAVWVISAQSAPPACDPRLLGTWEVNMSTFPASDPPKSFTFTWKDIGGGNFTVQGTAVRAGGQIEEGLIMVGPKRADGMRPLSGAPNMDSETIVSPDPRTLVETTFKDGRQVETHTYRFSLDSRQLTIDSDNVNAHLSLVMNKK
jgi:hypothetical protein